MPKVYAIDGIVPVGDVIVAARARTLGPTAFLAALNGFYAKVTPTHEL
jgi:hypothetical protein